MNKIFFLTFTALLLSLNSNSQCNIEFNELFISTNFSNSQFDTFALKKGFSYNSNLEGYLCDIPYKIVNGHSFLGRKLQQNKYTVLYSFISKTQYLDYKTIIEGKGKVMNNNNNSKNLELMYVYDNKMIILATSSIETIPTYTILISEL